MNLKNYLNQLYPIQVSKWRLVILISLFVLIFLLIFQPFGLSYLKNNKIITISGYGLVTFIVLLIDLYIIKGIFPKTFEEKNWTIWKEFTWLIWIIFSIGLGNVLYTIIVLDYFQFNLDLIIRFELITLSIGIIPVIILLIINQNHQLKKNLNTAVDFNKNLVPVKTKSDEIIRIYSENEKDNIELNNSEFYFIESSGNYIDIYFSNGNELRRKTFRSTLKKSLEYLRKESRVVQCHRAFIVNTEQIVEAKGNSQGLRLILKDCEIEIPVSRTFVTSVREIISQH